MRKGDLVKNEDGWLGRVQGISSAPNVLLMWETGPMKGRNGRVPKSMLKVVAKTEPGKPRVKE
tara:strand:- start:346 stop:534 length:189 start_codon:yes stop_codon:yes gene_type:complete